MADPQTAKPTVTIDGDKQITTWEDKDGFTMFIEPRPVTAKDINDVLMKVAKDNPDVVVGTFNGVRLIK